MRARPLLLVVVVRALSSSRQFVTLRNSIEIIGGSFAVRLVITSSGGRTVYRVLHNRSCAIETDRELLIRSGPALCRARRD